MKFRRKPGKTIEAVQYLGLPIPGVKYDNNNQPYVETIHLQRCNVVVGDWIVAEPDEIHYYPIKDHVFQATYENLPASDS